MVVLQEHDERTHVRLTPEQAAALRRYEPEIDVSPSVGEGWDVKTSSWIGVIRAGNLAVEIRPKLPIRRVLFLLSYSLDPATWREEEFDFRETPNLLEALAPAFIALAQRTLARGLLRDYRAVEDTLASVRGRIRFNEQIRRWYGRTPPVEVAYDEFTEDIDENRLLLAAVNRLGRLRPRSKAVRRGLRGLRSRLPGVTPVRYGRQPLPDIEYNRRNRHYRPALRLARLLLSGSSLRTRHGETTATSFLINMNRVFEDFVVAALREALDLSPRQFPQQASGRRLWLDDDRSVKLKPDFSQWIEGECTVVGDVKYKSLVNEGVRNSDLYQVLSYLLATGLDRGHLVYAHERSTSRTITVQKQRRTIRVVGLDVTAPPDDILAQVERVARALVEGASGATGGRSTPT